MIFRPNISATLDLALETRVSTIGTDDISDRSKLNNQPRAQSTRCPLTSLCDTGNSCCSQRSMDLERVASVPISVPSCSTAKSVPTHAGPISYGTLLSSMLAPSPEAARVVKRSIENSNAVPAVVLNPSLSRSCNRIGVVRDDRIIPLPTKLSPSFLSSGGFVRQLRVASKFKVLSYLTDMDSDGLRSIKQRLASWIEVKEMLSQLKPSLRLGKQSNKPYRTRSSYYRQHSAWEVLGILRKWQLLKGKELWQAQGKAYMTPPPPDESIFPSSVNAKLRRQVKLASDKSTGVDCCL